MVTKIEHDSNQLVIDEQILEKERMKYHLKKDSGLWVESKELIQRSFILSIKDDYIFDFMSTHVLNGDNFIKDVEGVNFYCEKTKKSVKLTGPEARHFVENYKMPSTIPTNNYIYSMMFGKLDVLEYNVYIYVYFKDIIVDFSNNWRDKDSDNIFTIIPRNP